MPLLHCDEGDLWLLIIVQRFPSLKKQWLLQNALSNMTLASIICPQIMLPFQSLGFLFQKPASTGSSLHHP